MDAPVTLTITDLAKGPTAPRANATWPNALHMRIDDVVRSKGPAPWSQRLIADERNLVTLIASPPGGGNRPHWHREFDEWWMVLAGTLEWELTGNVVVRARVFRRQPRGDTPRPGVPISGRPARSPR